ncbi:hypothetical protein IGI04_023226 [Brassica rapa subsp. trilocularis]|uniref:Protein kinase domain-containing protein n=1 Tax=Brassica rapa subsp. trilocularis TaxID=1813537 RepID=A0ABQ7M394_BRACM|nr:hypothetical protein IGI04_023226 [Brassica rapa subsp. trilocularis]
MIHGLLHCNIVRVDGFVKRDIWSDLAYGIFCYSTCQHFGSECKDMILMIEERVQNGIADSLAKTVKFLS